MIEVPRGQFEPARQLTSDFYTTLRREIDGGSGSPFTSSQRENLKSLPAERDELMTLLARSDPAGTHRLLNVYSAYNELE